MAAEDLVIWWVDQPAAEAIQYITGLEEGTLPDTVPEYLRDEYRSRYDRAGRGRLWVADEFGEVSVSPWPDTLLGRLLGERYGGIVMRRGDLHHIQGYPRIITDLKLNRIMK